MPCIFVGFILKYLTRFLFAYCSLNDKRREREREKKFNLQFFIRRIAVFINNVDVLIIAVLHGYHRSVAFLQYRRVTRQFLISLIILSEINAAQKTRACNVTLLNDMFASTASIDGQGSECMNGVGDIERMEVSHYKDFRAIFQSVLRPAFVRTQRRMDACTRAKSRERNADEN